MTVSAAGDSLGLLSRFALLDLCLWFCDECQTWTFLHSVANVSGKIAVEMRPIPIDPNVLSQCVYFGLRASELQ